MMIRLMKSDFYRLIKSKGIWLTFISAMAFAVISVLTKSVFILANVPEGVEDTKWTLTTSLNNSFVSSTLLLFLVATFLIVTLAQEFSQNTFKNTLTNGISRTSFVLAKSFVLSIVIFLYYLAYELVTFITASIKYGFDKSFDRAFINHYIFSTLNNCISLIAIVLLAAFLVYLTRNNILASVFLVLCPIIIQILLAAINNDTITKYLKFFNYLSIVQQTGFNMLSTHDMWQFAFTSLAVIVFSIIGSIVVFRKKEL